MRRVALRQENQLAVDRTAIGMHADDPLAAANQSVHRCLGQVADAESPGVLGEVAVVDRPQDRVAVAEGLGVAILGAGERGSVAGEEAALHHAPLVGRALQLRVAQHVGLGQVLGEVDGAGPVLGARVDGGLDDEHVERFARQAKGGGDPGRATTDDDDIPQLLAHRRSSDFEGTTPGSPPQGEVGPVEAR